MNVFNEQQLKSIYDYIINYQRTNGKAPSYRLIMKNCNLGSLATVCRNVNDMIFLCNNTKQVKMKRNKFLQISTENCLNSSEALPLEVISLYKKYSKKTNYAITDVTFSACKGEIVGLLGPNGAGKSTTLKCITNMIPITSGEVFICGYSLKTSPIQALKQLSFVTDNHSVFVKMTGMQYLSFMADVFGVEKSERERRISELDEYFKMGDDIYKLIAEYSHGMKQKICMMGSLIHKPKLWILDEPMIGLDPRTQCAVIDFIHSYASQGNTILLSSHNLDAVKRICDRAIFIKGGKITTIIDLKNNSQETSELEKYYLSQEE